MREFTAEYLETTRAGMWADSRAALADLDLGARERVLDVGCGTGELTRVLREESGATVVGMDVDPELLAVASEHAPVARADAHLLPVGDDSFDLVVCQALLINLFEPGRAVAEFARVSSDLVAAIEPDNSAVTVDSTVDAEPRLAGEARRAFLDGVRTDVALGSGARDLFSEAGLDVVSTTRYEQVRTVEPPYSEAALEAARRKVTGQGLDNDRETILAGDTTETEYDRLHERWRAMGRTVVDQMNDGNYERTETVPFYVTVGRVPDAEAASSADQ